MDLDDDDPWLTVRDVAQVLCVGYTRAYYLMESGRIPGVIRTRQVEGGRRAMIVRLSDVQRYVRGRGKGKPG